MPATAAAYNTSMAPPIYLDHNATTPLLPAVADRLAEARAAGYANPASQHTEGRRARRALEAARDEIAGTLGAQTASLDADRLVFTSGGTEANVLALRGLAGPPGGTLIVSSIEHPSVAETAEQMQREGYRVERLRVDGRGVASTDHLEELLASCPDVRLVAVMLGNNETGVLQPVERLACSCQAAGVLMHTDAVQVVGKLPVDFHKLGVTSLACTAHKLHGPRGIGALLLRSGGPLEPMLRGGPQQGGLRAGTEVVDLAIGFAAAITASRAEQPRRAERMARLRDRFETTIRSRAPHISVIGESTERLPHTSCLAFEGHDRQALMMALDLAGVACSTGSACASGSSEPSPALVAMGLPPTQIRGALRFSLGALTTEAEIEDAAGRICGCLKGLGSGESRGAAAVHGSR